MPDDLPAQTAPGDSQDPSNTDVDDLVEPLDPDDDVFGLLTTDPGTSPDGD